MSDERQKSYGGKAPTRSEAMKRFAERFGIKHRGPLPEVRVSDEEPAEGEEREVVLSRDRPLGGVIETLEVHDLDDVKRMIGVPDRLAERKKRPVRPLDYDRYPPQELERAFAAGEMTADQYEFVTAVGRAYVFGHSLPVQQYKAIVTEVFTRGSGGFFLTAACFGSLWILNGWTLVLGSDIQAFCADRLLLEPLAKVKRKGGADINLNVGLIQVVEPQLPI